MECALSWFLIGMATKKEDLLHHAGIDGSLQFVNRITFVCNILLNVLRGCNKDDIERKR